MAPKNKPTNEKQKKIKTDNIEKIKDAKKDLFKIFYKKINDFIEKNKEEYALIYFCEEEIYFMVVKKTKLFVKEINLNNVFQPYECQIYKEFPILSIICINHQSKQLSNAHKDPIFIENVKKFGGKVLRINLKDNFEEKMTAFFS